jgi:hypothetical protein
MPISRLFSTEADALAAVSDLKQAGFGAARIRVLSSKSGNATATAIALEGVPKAEAASHAERIARGGALVLADAPFGAASRAIEVLQRQRPGDTGPAEAHYGTPATHDDAAPLSALFQWPVLSKNPSPFSSFFNLPTLSRGRHGNRTFGLPLVLRKAAPLSSLLGLPVLSRNAAPLSSAAGMKTLSAEAAPLSSALGMKTLTQQQTFLY